MGNTKGSTKKWQEDYYTLPQPNMQFFCRTRLPIFAPDRALDTVICSVYYDRTNQQWVFFFNGQKRIYSTEVSYEDAKEEAILEYQWTYDREEHFRYIYRASIRRFVKQRRTFKQNFPC